MLGFDTFCAWTPKSIERSTSVTPSSNRVSHPRAAAEMADAGDRMACVVVAVTKRPLAVIPGLAPVDRGQTD